jgi:hypothetical protein
MTSVDPIRRSQPSRKAKRANGKARGAEAAQSANLPAIIEPASQPAPPEPIVESHAVFAAQLLGQGGEKRGLRGGPSVLEAATASYNRAEWSGSKDRRARVGKHAKADV